MSSFSEDDEENRFFDAQESIASVSDSGSDGFECPQATSELDHSLSRSFQYDLWIRSPRSVRERRSKFLSWMELSLDRTGIDNSVDSSGYVYRGDVARIMDSGGAVLRNVDVGDEFSYCQSSVSSQFNDASGSAREPGLWHNFDCRIMNHDGGAESNMYGLGLSGNLTEFQVLGAGQTVAAKNFEDPPQSSPSGQHRLQRETNATNRVTRTVDSVKSRWFNRLRSLTCIMDGQTIPDNLRRNDTGTFRGKRVQRVKVRHCKKRQKELSALFIGQDIQAHEGSILSMKFSLDGQYLASAGEDKVVRVWQVVEDNRSNDVDIPELDPSCVYFTVNQLSDLAPLVVEKEKISKLKNLRKTADSACVIFPPKVFRMLPQPLHEFHGHSEEILDLSWSHNHCLLSSSIDKTVRLWQVGCDQCLKVFPHSNYVTSVQFNPVDDNYFVSGSIDGKVRIWAVNSCQVVDWSVLKDIITAVSYCPDGKGGIIGTMTGNCRFFNVSDNHLQLEAEICLNSKKKTPCRRITGFQFLPQVSNKVLVTCADAQIRILHGVNVIAKYKGLRNAGSQSIASLTSDGKHIVSACDDSSVYLWNCVNKEECPLSQSKTIRSFECFSIDASVAIPWCGLKSGTAENGWPRGRLEENTPSRLPLSSPAHFSLGQEFFLESIPKGSATWPEEKLPPTSPSTVGKSQYKFLKASCQSSVNSHAWGMVIVTAGWDGRIRSFHNYGLPVPL